MDEIDTISNTKQRHNKKEIVTLEKREKRREKLDYTQCDSPLHDISETLKKLLIL